MTMRIDASATIARVPATVARAFARRLCFAEECDLDDAGRWLGLRPRQARAAIAELCALGFLEPHTSCQRPQTAVWRLTPAGVSLANARASRPIRRATAERLVAGLLERAAVLRGTEHPYAYVLAELVIYGSYLTDAPSLGDVDVGYLLARRYPGDQGRDYAIARIRAAQDAGRRFGNISNMYAWPEVEMLRFLTGGSRAFSLQDLRDSREFIESVPHRRVIP